MKSKHTATSATKRQEDDPRVVRIMRALGVAAQMADGSDLPSAVSCIISLGGSGEDFEGWSDDAARAVMLAYALHAPEDHLEALADHADHVARWSIWYDAPGGGKYQGLRFDHERDADLVREANKLLEVAS